MLHQLKINYPETLLDVLQQTPTQFEEDAKWAMAAKLYGLKRISSDMAAQLVGSDHVTFMMNLHLYETVNDDLNQ